MVFRRRTEVSNRYYSQRNKLAEIVMLHRVLGEMNLSRRLLKRSYPRVCFFLIAD